MTHSFLKKDAWTGGSVDALMFFGPATASDAIAVSNALWSFPRLAGPYRHRHIEPKQQSVVIHPKFSTDGCELLFGVYQNHDDTCSNFVHSTIFDDDGLWVYAGLTVGSFPTGWNIGAYPTEDGLPAPWLKPLYEDLRLVTQHVNHLKDIRGAIYGWLTTVDCDTLLEAIAGTIPTQRWNALDVWRDGKCQHYAPTHL